jgi:hypothetical protein
MTSRVSARGFVSGTQGHGRIPNPHVSKLERSGEAATHISEI